jgi:flagellar biosynthesis protein FlhF
MLIREYEANSLKECLTQIRNELGPEAIILDTRKARKGGLLGIGAREIVRVVAATGLVPREEVEAKSRSSSQPKEEDNPTETAGATSAAAARAYRTIAAVANNHGDKLPPQTRSATATKTRPPSTVPTPSILSKPHAEERLPASASKARRPTPALNNHSVEPAAETTATNGAKKTSISSTQRIGELEQALAEIREALDTLQQQQRLSQEQTVTAVVSALAPVVAPTAPTPLVLPACPELYQKLLEIGVDENLARDLVENLPDVSRWSEQARLPMALSALSDLIARRIPIAAPLAPTPGQLTTVVFIGPTGVGKTTTIAKLAARFALLEHKRVALLTVDTYRIAAVEQLKTYGQIMDIPVRVAYDQSEAVAALRECADYDLLLIDTAGRSQKNTMQVGELKSLIDRLNTKSYLVLSACMKERDMLEAVERFSKARVDNLIFTKLDETDSRGSLLNVLDKTGVPLAYITTGQKVPEDIEAADGRRFAHLLLEEGC